MSHYMPAYLIVPVVWLFRLTWESPYGCPIVIPHAVSQSPRRTRHPGRDQINWSGVYDRAVGVATERLCVGPQNSFAQDRRARCLPPDEIHYPGGRRALA